jgi:hypothetical protein
MTPSVPRTELDDGQTVEGQLDDLTQHQLIGYANQLYRSKRPDEARDVMEYQHERFHNTPEEAA